MNDILLNKWLRTIMFDVTNIMFDKNLFSGKITWTGATKKPGERRIACKDFKHILKLVHAIMLSFNGDVTLQFVEKFFHKTLCIFAKKRSGNQGLRGSVAKGPAEKDPAHELTVEYQTDSEEEIDQENEGEKADEMISDNDLIASDNIPANDVPEEDEDNEQCGGMGSNESTIGSILLVNKRRITKRKLSSGLQKDAKKKLK